MEGRVKGTRAAAPAGHTAHTHNNNNNAADEQHPAFFFLFNYFYLHDVASDAPSYCDSSTPSGAGAGTVVVDIRHCRRHGPGP